MYSDSFEKAVDHAMKYEVGGFWDINAPGARDGTNKKASGYVNDPTDAGGETKYGIAKNANPNVDITNLNWETAKEIYYKKYWLAANCDKLSNQIAILHFDSAVNHGVSRSIKFLQCAINVTDDGIFGQQTLDAINKLNSLDVCNSICNQREKFYNDIVLNKPTQSKFLKGWLRRITEIRDYVTKII